jgi:hypothetical protein
MNDEAKVKRNTARGIVSIYEGTGATLPRLTMERLDRCRVDAEEPHWGREFESSVGRRLGRRDLERRQPGGAAFAQKGVLSGGADGCRAAGGAGARTAEGPHLACQGLGAASGGRAV